MHVSCPTLFDPKIEVNRKTKRALVRYLGGLILYPGKKNCSSIAQASNVTHDVVYDFFECCIDEQIALKSFLMRAVSLLPFKKGKWYVDIDETMIEKMFSKNIEGAAYNWNSTINDSMKGYSIVAAVVTNGKITIPITFKTWYSAKHFPDRHKTRIELAQSLMTEIHKTLHDVVFLMDGAFSSEDMIRFCRTNKMKYCMRFHSNKKIVISGKEAQVRNHERIKISSKRKARVVKASYKGEPVLIVAFKRTDKKGKTKIVYLVTSERDTPKTMIKTYRKRWGIEKVFRTTKQYLGLKDCQARSALKQKTHIWTVFVAYAFLEIQKINHKTKNPEQILHKIRRGESRDLLDQFETFCGVA